MKLKKKIFGNTYTRNRNTLRKTISQMDETFEMSYSRNRTQWLKSPVFTCDWKWGSPPLSAQTPPHRRLTPPSAPRSDHALSGTTLGLFATSRRGSSSRPCAEHRALQQKTKSSRGDSYNSLKKKSEIFSVLTVILLESVAVHWYHWVILGNKRA